MSATMARLSFFPWLAATALFAVSDSLAEAAPPVLTPLGALIADADGNTIPDGLNGRYRVRGVVTAGNRTLQPQNYQLLIQDDTGGVSLFSRTEAFADVQPGRVVEANGKLGQFRGAAQLFIEKLELLDSVSVPEAIPVPMSEADSWQHMGRRVQVEGLAGPFSLEGHGRLRVDGDDGTALNLYIPQPVIGEFDWSRYPRGARIEATGVASIYKETWPYDGGFQLVVTRPEDLRVLAPPTPRWMQWGLYASLPAAGLLALSLLLFVLSQRRQRLRQQELATLSALSAAFAQPDLDALQLARRAGDTLSAYGVAAAVCVHLIQPDGTLSCVASSADSADHQRRLEALLSTPLDDDAASSGPAKSLRVSGVAALACHPLPSTEGNLGWLSVPALGHRRLTAMQQRILLAAVKLLALALENRQIREQAERERAALHQLAVTDDLTGLYNRRFLDEYLRVQIPIARRRGSGLGFLSLDIDHFKPINDRYGHPVGDAVLRHVAAALRGTVRNSDLPVRMGGEEFLVVAAESGLEGSMQLAERLRSAIAAIDLSSLGLDPPPTVTVSVGVAQFGVHGESSERLLQGSDDALYAAKRDGRNRVAVAAASDDGSATDSDAPG